jgi:predicted dienelactone hydrolase
MYRCGYESGVVLDESRTSWDGEGLRPILWSVWYPTNDARDDLGGAEQSLEVFDLGNVLPYANPLDHAAARIVLLSHGTGGTAESLGWVASQLAERGCMVIAANHHGNCGKEEYRPEGFICWWERAADLSLLLTHFLADSRFGHLVRDVPVATIGYSLGAHAALALSGGITSMPQFRDWAVDHPVMARGPREFPDLSDRLDRLFETSAAFRQSWARHGQSYRDARVSVAILLAPPPPVRAFTPSSISSIEIPVAVLAAANDIEADPDVCARWLCSQNAQFELTTFAAADHYAFLGPLTARGATLLSELVGKAGPRERAQMHAAIGRKILDLLYNP